MTQQMACDVCGATTKIVFGEKGWWELKRLNTLADLGFSTIQHICPACFDYLKHRPVRETS